MLSHVSLANSEVTCTKRCVAVGRAFLLSRAMSLVAPVTAPGSHRSGTRHTLSQALLAAKPWPSSPWLTAAKHRGVFAACRRVLRCHRQSCLEIRPLPPPFERVPRWSDLCQNQY